MHHSSGNGDAVASCDATVDICKALLLPEAIGLSRQLVLHLPNGHKLHLPDGPCQVMSLPGNMELTPCRCPYLLEDRRADGHSK